MIVLLSRVIAPWWTFHYLEGNCDVQGKQTLLLGDGINCHSVPSSDIPDAESSRWSTGTGPGRASSLPGPGCWQQAGPVEGHHTGCMMCTQPLMECRSASPFPSVAYPENLVRWIHGKMSGKASTNKLYKYNVRVPGVFRQYQIQFWKFHRWCRGLNWPRYVELHTDVTWHHAALHVISNNKTVAS